MTQQIQRFRLGDFDCVIITDGNYAGTAERIFKHALGEELAQVLEKHQEEADDLPAGQNCLYVDTGDNKVLVDTGIGPGVMAQTGKLIDNLALAGVQPTSDSKGYAWQPAQGLS